MVAGFVLYVLYERVRSVESTLVVVPSEGKPPLSQGVYKDGEYIGNVADAYYGDLQIKATIKNGRIADIYFLKYPNDRQTSVMINSEAMPLLKSEAITAQSASVDIVSGATDSSKAFQESLAYALNQAKP